MGKFGGVSMVLLAFFSREKRREKRIQRGKCPDCSGKGFFSSGFESLHVQDCNTCLGTGKPVKE
ncbi:hypothetical protein [Neobacillus niacini]|uniref:hypothetical protein n=1 Tax=Neobacillus niacini TaxID=86668 RepID=UPI0021CB3C55|nr:hypothetical protein [Neobacillus niacini]MCM3768291.1 hypothetical protein [Neobacillus niacini]